MLRATMLRLAESDRIHRIISQNGMSRGLVQRFVAGETLQAALEASAELNARGMLVTLDLLGENVTEPDAARAAATEYRMILDRCSETGVASTISVKLTMLGLDISDNFCRDLMLEVLDTARATDNFVRIDMEGSPYTQRTLDIFYDLHESYGDHVGIVLQSYLYRNDTDVKTAIERGARVRLVKGAYAEPPEIAYPKKKDVDAAYRRQMEWLMDHGNYPAIATQDDAIIDVAKGYALRMGIDPSRYEFQMMFGIRRDLQEQLVDEGYNMRVYVPYGDRWYPYFTRRLAERPANVIFVLRNLLRP
jgi:proline dehydrogenase